MLRTFLAKVCVLAMIAGGFAVTGDVGRLLARGRGVIDATTVPRHADDPPEDRPDGEFLPPEPPAPAPRTPAGSPQPASPSPEYRVVDAPTATGSTVLPHDAPVGLVAPAQPPPSQGLSRIEVGTLSPGDRIVIWVGKGARGARTTETIAFDVVDPAAAEVIEIRHLPGDVSVGSHAPHRRMRIVGSVVPGLFGRTMTPACIERRHSLQVVPLGGHAGGATAGATETIGPIQAIALQPAAMGAAPRSGDR